MVSYRKIWEQQNGKIPIDPQGRSYEIHHIDGNRKNNDITNLLCVNLDEHYKIHYDQGDWIACLRMSERMNISTTEKSELARKATKNKKWITNGTVDKHVFYSEHLPEGFRHGRSKGKRYGPRSEEFKQKMSEIRKGKPLSDAHRNSLRGLKRGMYGKNHSEETKQKMRKPKTESHCKAISDSKRGLTGKAHSEETKLKMAESQRMRRLKEKQNASN